MLSELILAFLLQSVAIVVAGSLLVRYADALGDYLGLGRSLVGLLLLAIATSLPELLVGCHAANMGAVDLAVGDLLGSSLFNLMILAILDLATTTRGRMLSRTASAHALSAVASIVLTVLVLLFLVLKLEISFGRIGIGSLAIGMAYLFCVRLIYVDQQFAEAQQQAAKTANASSISRLQAIIGYICSTGVIVYVAPKMAATSIELAEVTGLGGTFFGTMFVALISSMPEGVTTLSAIRIGASDMAIGNILGSNTFNMVMFIGLDLAYGSPLFAAAGPVHTVTAASVILVTSVAILGLLYRAEKKWWVFEPDAVLVIMLVVGALALVYRLGVHG